MLLALLTPEKHPGKGGTNKGFMEMVRAYERLASLRDPPATRPRLLLPARPGGLAAVYPSGLARLYRVVGFLLGTSRVICLCADCSG